MDYLLISKRFQRSKMSKVIINLMGSIIIISFIIFSKEVSSTDKSGNSAYNAAIIWNNYEQKHNNSYQNNLTQGKKFGEFTALIKQFSGNERFDFLGIIKDDFIVNDDLGASHQLYPSIAMDNIDNFIIVWEDKRNADDNFYNTDIYFQCFNSMGETVGINLKVNDDTGTSGQRLPAIAAHINGSFIISWFDYRNGNEDIYIQRYSSKGIPIGVNTKVNDDSDHAFQRIPQIDICENGNFVVVWEDCRNNFFDIYFQLFDSSGTPIGSNQMVEREGSGGQRSPSVVMNTNGEFIISWEEYVNDADNVYFHRYSAEGVSTGQNIKVNDELTDSNSHCIDMNGNGNFVIAWERRISGSYNDIYCQQYDSAGNTKGENFRVNDSDKKINNFPAVVINEIGNYAITWQCFVNKNYNIFGQIYHSDGSANGANFKITSNDSGNTINTTAVSANASWLVYTWAQEYLSTGYDVVCKIATWDWGGVTSHDIPLIYLPVTSFKLKQNYPNPFNQETIIEFELFCADHISLNIFDITGRLIRTLLDEYKQAGHYYIIWNGKNAREEIVPSGLYIYQMKNGNNIDLKKMLLLK